MNQLITEYLMSQKVIQIFWNEMNMKKQQNFWDTLKSVVRVKCIVLNMQKNQKEHKQMTVLQLKNLEK